MLVRVAMTGMCHSVCSVAVGDEPCGKQTQTEVQLLSRCCVLRLAGGTCRVAVGKSAASFALLETVEMKARPFNESHGAVAANLV